VNTMNDAVRVSLKVQRPLVEVARTQRNKMHFLRLWVAGRALSYTG
jgi:hypothetical protein